MASDACPGHARRPRRPDLRTGPALAAAALARAARRAAAGGRAVDPTRPLRGSGRGGPSGPRRRRHHRRDADRQAGPAWTGRSGAARPALRQQMVDAAGRSRALRRDVRRGRRGARRRRHRPARRGPLADVHHLLRRGHGLGVGGELAADRAPRMAGPCHAAHHRAGQHQRRRPPITRARRTARRGRRPLRRGVRVHERPHRATGRRRRLRAVAHRVHRRAVLRAARAGRLRAARLGGAARPRPRSRGGALRRRGAADPAPGEGPRHRRSGHRRSDEGLQRRAGFAREARQGRLRRPSRTAVAARERDRSAARRTPARGRIRGAPRGQPDRRERPNPRPDHLQPDVADPEPVGLPGPDRRRARRRGHRSHRPATGRQADHRPGHGAARSRRPGGPPPAAPFRRSGRPGTRRRNAGRSQSR